MVAPSGRFGRRWAERLSDGASQVMGRIDSLIAQAQKRGYPGEPVVSVTF